MRVVTREEFMRMPEGTLFLKGRPWAFGDLCVKGETIIFNGRSMDWFYLPTGTIEANDSGELFDRMGSMLKDGASYPLDLDCQSKDGCFDSDDVFLIYEAADIRAMVDLFGGLIARNDHGQD